MMLFSTVICHLLIQAIDTRHYQGTIPATSPGQPYGLITQSIDKVVTAEKLGNAMSQVGSLLSKTRSDAAKA